jgi:DNA polymerase I-like protein with 3'-5' exonuclease and polymerase domains
VNTAQATPSLLEDMGLPDVENLDVACDTESSGLYPDDGATLSLVSLAFETRVGEFAFSLPFDQGRYEDKRGLNTLFPDSTDENLSRAHWYALLGWLSKQRLWMWNAKHDLTMLAEGTRHWPGMDLAHALVWDGMIAEWILEPDPSTRIGLDPASRRYGYEGKIDMGLVLDAHKGRYGTRTKPRYDLMPFSMIDEYARKDALLTYRTVNDQIERIETLEPATMRIVRREIELTRTLFWMEQRGIGYDRERSLQIAAKAQALVGQITRALPFEPTPPRASAWFYGTKEALPHCVTEKNGKPSARDCCIRKLTEHPDREVARAAQQYARLAKLNSAISKWYLGYADKVGQDGRLRTDFKQTKTEDEFGGRGVKGTVNYRLASARVNLQAIPHDYRLDEELRELGTPRDLIMAPYPIRLYELDLSQAEVRVGAVKARCQTMIDLIMSGGDIHANTAIEVLHADPNGSDWKKWRNVGKRGNFSLIYNVGPKTFKEDLEKQTGIVISLAESKAIVDGFRRVYPEFNAANQLAERLVKSRGYVILSGGRKRWFSAEEKLYNTHKAFNAVVQGSIAEFMKLAMVEVEKNWPGVLLLQIHDSLVIETADPEVPAQIQDHLARMATEFFGVPMELDVNKWGRAA